MIPGTAILMPPNTVGSPKMRIRLTELELVGEEALDQIEVLCPIQPDMAVLDVGCGLGRIGLAFSHFLDADGSYEGLDIDEARITWCRDRITVQFPNIRFSLADLQNGMYNAGGSAISSELTFPYPDDSFDLVHLSSVFTHMLPADVSRYVKEIGRVLRPGGWSWISYFLITNPAEAEPHRGFGPWTLSADRTYRYKPSAPVVEAAIAYDEDWVCAQYVEAGLAVEEIAYGSWRGALPDGIEVSSAEHARWRLATRRLGQDIVVGRKVEDDR